ncbi:hypothetical protein OH76DRAFT_1486585 [Lentinus brumalis]|uniref:Uncharacterized protein n=1 Tax=Lentinus brumalis TaxID=2498619 RepID=A0A371CXW8_9APHY|nr:hypothetical protein OH76DRAFT_1486585 [Polyporus brumalis]
MSDRFDSNRDRLDLGGNASSPTLRGSTTPLVFVPATPSTSGHATIATDDENTPPALRRTSRSYAQVTAAPSVTTTTTVRPRNVQGAPASALTPQIIPDAGAIATAAIHAAPAVNVNHVAPPIVDYNPPMPATPVLRPAITSLRGIGGSFRLPPPAFPTAAGQLEDAVRTPEIQPVAISLADIDDSLVLPPPAHVWEGSQNLDHNESDTMSSLPDSSPISIPTTVAVSPDQNDTEQPTLRLDATNGSVTPPGESFEEFWAQFDTPVLPTTNLPSALQSPAILTTRNNTDIPLSQWPAPNQAANLQSHASPFNDENRPPMSNALDSHPPVASRYRRKRRGTSPPPGERVRKIAKRRNKGKEVERTPHVQQDEILTNPWASSFPSANAPGPSSQTLSLLTPSPLPSSSFGSINHTPYSDFTRRTSSTTTYYRRMNESASFPTPHRISPSPDTATPPTTQGLSQPRSRLAGPDLQTIGTREMLPVERRTSTRTRHTGNNAQEDTSRHSPANTSSATRRQPSIHDTPMCISPLPEDDQSLDVHQSERAHSSTPDLTELREHTYRSPTVEDIPEEGEIDEDRHVEETAWGPAFPQGSCSYIDRRPPLSTRSFQYNPDYEGAGHPRRFFEHAASTRLGTSSVRTTTGLDTRPPSRMSTIAERDHVSPDRTPSTRSISAPPDPLHDMLSTHPLTASSLPSRSPGLDIFNLSNDDNVPEAVRRGGPLAMMDDERPTPIPHEGDPEVHQHDPESHLRGMSDDWIQEVWADPAGTSITLSTFNPRFTKSYGSNS